MSIKHTVSDRGPWYATTEIVLDDHRTAAIIQWQNGPIKDVGVNGAQIDEVLRACLEWLTKVNEAHSSTFNAEAIGHLESALNALASRTRDRQARGVEGTSKP